MNDKFISNKEKKEEEVVVTPLPKIGKIVGCDFLNIRMKPSLNAPVTGILSKSEPLVIDETLDGWYKVSIGYVKAEFVEIA